MLDLIINAAIFGITFLLVVRLFRADGTWSIKHLREALKFFTVLSNIFCAAAALLMCLFPRSHTVWVLKYVGTAAVMVTMLTVFLFLAPSLGKGGLAQLLQGSDLFMHLLTPLMALFSFCVLERRGLDFGTALLGILSVALYGPWYLYRIRFAPEDRRMEDFYGFNRNGNWAVSFAAMLAGTFLLCMGLMALQNL